MSNYIEECISRIVKTEIRKGEVIKGKEVLETLPELLDTVCVDKRRIKGAVEKGLKSENPLNAILNLFGLQIIKKDMANSILEEDDSDFDEKQWLIVERDKAQDIVGKIANQLYQIEKEASQNYDDEKNRGDELFKKNQKLTEEYNLLKSDLDATERTIAERVQYILSLNGEAADENEQLIELLRDMDIEIYWESDKADLSAAAMFTEYRMNDHTLNTKPCLVRNGKVYIKGIRFISEN